MGTITQDDVLEILRMLKESDFDELHLEMGDLKLVVKRVAGRAEAVPEIMDTSGEPPQPAAVDARLDAATERQGKIEETIPSEGRAQEPETLVPSEEEGRIPIKAPMLGTFYRAPKPGAPPFVEVGQMVTEDNTVCIIEVMKLFNTIKAGVSGRVVKICAENAELVEFKQTLFLVENVPEEGKLYEESTR
jgi:acetyl-CoA carboxylase biotin carboxyl carrier protein